MNDGLVDLTGGSGGIHDGWNRRKEVKTARSHSMNVVDATTPSHGTPGVIQFHGSDSMGHLDSVFAALVLSQESAWSFYSVTGIPSTVVRRDWWPNSPAREECEEGLGKMSALKL